MPRFVFALIIGVGALLNGWYRLGTPATDAEQTGWLYTRFGPNGIGWGMIVLGAAMLVIGALMLRAWLAAVKMGEPKVKRDR
ncbi:hypothetical protein AMC78_CH02546 [Rhizobium phaseoli]|uniref:hypothetical protein n=1 Tax=Rhizobium phaseoli TaxID=396 RepID=UPI0007EBE637|nr:hypothetical protein [Rhizobium phaseoli]ANM04633.1 hypothetical protein AMC78_CH02546 [Rhizobium phaseoli]